MIRAVAGPALVIGVNSEVGCYINCLFQSSIYMQTSMHLFSLISSIVVRIQNNMGLDVRKPIFGVTD